MAEYIERDMTIALLRKRGLEAAEVIGQVFSNGIFDAVRFLNEQHAADVAPVVHGKFEVIEDGDIQSLCRCSNCKEEIMMYYEYVPNYCPTCGSKMDKEATDGN